MITENFTVNQGDQFEFEFTVQDDDITLTSGWQALFQVRKFAGAEVVAESTELDGITFTATNAGTVVVSPAKTAAIKPGRYQYQLELEKSTGEVYTLLGGSFTVTQDIAVRA